MFKGSEKEQFPAKIPSSKKSPAFFIKDNLQAAYIRLKKKNKKTSHYSKTPDFRRFFYISLNLDPVVKICYNTSWFGQ